MKRNAILLLTLCCLSGRLAAQDNPYIKIAGEITSYTWELVMISIFMMLVLFTLAILIYRQYRKKNTVFHEMVRISQEWAQVSSTGEPLYADIPDLPDETDRHLFDRLNILMSDRNIYCNPDITIEQVAHLLETNSHDLSQAINRCTSVNFSSCINAFRIKEAVNILSDSKSQTLPIEAVALNTGFNDCSTFNLIFKKLTGLSPTEFRNNLNW
jgi:YesN/AraC family two-component response regulator